MTQPVNQRVLIVDDEHAIRRFLRASLTAHGYTIHEAATGEEALQVVVNARPDVIILDLGLPGHRRPGGHQAAARVEHDAGDRLVGARMTRQRRFGRWMRAPTTT